MGRGLPRGRPLLFYSIPIDPQNYPLSYRELRQTQSRASVGDQLDRFLFTQFIIHLCIITDRTCRSPIQGPVLQPIGFGGQLDRRILHIPGILACPVTLLHRNGLINLAERNA